MIFKPQRNRSGLYVNNVTLRSNQPDCKLTATWPHCSAGRYWFFGNRYDISKLKSIFSIYLFRWVLFFRFTYEIVLNFFGNYSIWYKKINKITLPRPDFSISDRCCPTLYNIVQYSFLVLFTDIAIFLQNQYHILVYCTALPQRLIY